MKKILLILTFTLVILSCEKNEIPNTIDFNTQNNLPMIKVNLNGKKAKFLVDSGASISILDSSAVSYYNFKVYRYTDMNVSGVGGRIKLYYVKDAKLIYGNEPMYVRFKSANLFKLRKELGIIGIIGGDFLIQNNMVLDYKNNKLRKSNILD